MFNNTLYKFIIAEVYMKDVLELQQQIHEATANADGTINIDRFKSHERFSDYLKLLHNCSFSALEPRAATAAVFMGVGAGTGAAARAAAGSSADETDRREEISPQIRSNLLLLKKYVIEKDEEYSLQSNDLEDDIGFTPVFNATDSTITYQDALSGEEAVISGVSEQEVDGAQKTYKANGKTYLFKDDDLLYEIGVNNENDFFTTLSVQYPKEKTFEELINSDQRHDIGVLVRKKLDQLREMSSANLMRIFDNEGNSILHHLVENYQGMSKDNRDKAIGLIKKILTPDEKTKTIVKQYALLTNSRKEVFSQLAKHATQEVQKQIDRLYRECIDDLSPVRARRADLANTDTHTASVHKSANEAMKIITQRAAEAWGGLVVGSDAFKERAKDEIKSFTNKLPAFLERKNVEFEEKIKTLRIKLEDISISPVDKVKTERDIDDLRMQQRLITRLIKTTQHT
jgi:hypothetical protein